MRAIIFLILCGILMSGGEALACASCFDDAPLEEKLRLRALDLALIQQEQTDYLRWVEAMPESIKPLWGRLGYQEEWHQVFHNRKPAILRTFQKALKEQFPDIRERILALYAWYGSGSGYWSGYPIYEMVAEEILLQYSINRLLEAAQTESLSEAQTEGAARFFASWDFRQTREDDLKLLPPELKAKLLEHTLRTGVHGDKKERAERAFGDHPIPLEYYPTSEEKKLFRALDDARDRQAQIDEDRWWAVMPTSIRPLVERMNADGDWYGSFQEFKEKEREPLQAALTGQFPDKRQRIKALYAWFGSGSGYWSGYPSYEEMAEDLLLDYSTDDLLDAALAGPLSEAQTEGAARLFAGWFFQRDRPDDLKLLPPELKSRLLEHSLKTAINDDKKGRAERAFGSGLPAGVEERTYAAD